MRQSTEEKKNHLLSSGMDLMHLYGYAATSVDDIVKAAGIPKGSFYNFYKSKELFAIDAMNLFSSWTLEKYNHIPQGDKMTAREKLIKIFMLSAKELKQSGFSKGCFIGNMAQEVGDTNPVMRQNIESCFLQLKQGILELIKQGIKDKSILANSKPEKLADFILNSYEGALLRMKTVKSSEPLDLFMEYINIILDKK